MSAKTFQQLIVRSILFKNLIEINPKVVTWFFRFLECHTAIQGRKLANNMYQR